MPSHREFEFDFPQFRLGTAEYPEGPTGCTVLDFPNGALAVCDVRGGSAAVRESTLLDPLAASGEIDSLVLTGGSTYGLDAASGVMRRLLEKRQKSVTFRDIPSVPAAVVYDFAGRDNAVHPDAELGARAWDSAVANRVRVGAAGAGVNVSVGKYLGRSFAERGGQGAAFLELDGVRLFALSVVNALGNIIGRDGEIVAGSLDRRTGKRARLADALVSRRREGVPSGNTTISALVTDARLGRLELQRIAIMAHSAMARVIEPFHTPSDGDVLFVASTRSHELVAGEVPAWTSDLGVLGGKLLQDAVLDAVK